jgi:hypothetical protein
MWCLQEAQIKLGTEAAADYLFTHDGLFLALRSARRLEVMPRLELVNLDGLG